LEILTLKAQSQIGEIAIFDIVELAQVIMCLFCLIVTRVAISLPEQQSTE
jgi:hypothetical protein